MKPKNRAISLSTIALLGIGAWGVWSLTGTGTGEPSGGMDGSLSAASSHSAHGEAAANRGLASAPKQAVQPPQAHKIPISEVLQNYDQDLTQKGRALFEERISAYLQRLKAAAVSKDQWISAGYSPEQDSLEGNHTAQLRFGVDQAGSLTPEELANAPEIDPSLVRAAAAQISMAKSGAPTRAEIQAVIRDNDKRIAEANQALAARANEVAALIKAGKKQEAEALEQSILATARGPASQANPNLGSESAYTPAERDEMGRRYIYTTFNREAEEGQ